MEGRAIAGCACREAVRLPEGEARAAKRSQEAARFRSDDAPPIQSDREMNSEG